MANQSHKNGAQPGRPRKRRDDAQRRASTVQKRANEEYYDRQYDEYDYDRSVKFANRGCLIVFALVAIAAAVVMIMVFSYVMGEINGKHGEAAGPVDVDIPVGAGGQIIGGILKDNELIGNDSIFRFYVRFNGAGGSFTAGDYTLQPGMSYDEILEVLTQPPADRETIRITFPEGITAENMAQIVEENGLCTAEEFLEEANNGEFDYKFFDYIEYDPNTYMRCEGYLRPDTYDFFTDSTPHEIVDTFYYYFNQTLENMTFNTAGGEIGFYDRLEQTGISLRDAVTLASLIEEEASSSVQDQPKVSAVFWSRMRTEEGSGMPRTMGSDVTLRYLADWVSHAYGHTSADFQDMTLEDMKVKLLGIMPAEVFYTYYTGDDDENTRAGLPGGPISNPSDTALKAALQPDAEYIDQYYYFLTTDLGNYYYGRNYTEHQRNINTMYAENEQAKAEAGGDDADG